MNVPIVVPATPTREELLVTAKSALQQEALIATHSHMNAAGVIQEYAKTPFGEQDIGSVVAQLKSSTEAVNSGDMEQCEAMLMGQAIALQSMFTHMSRRVLCQKYQKHMESFFAMALKAQNQCRMTLETLNEIKFPRQVAFVRQANIANGPQQVNNRRISRTREKSRNRTNKLLEQTNGNRLDSPAAPAAKHADSALAAVEAIDGAEDPDGQSDRRPQRLQGRPRAGQAERDTPSVKANESRKGRNL